MFAEERIHMEVTEVEHSSAYIDFKKQLKATGRQKLDGYYPDLLNSINEDEKREIERDIWTLFCGIMGKLGTSMTSMRFPVRSI